VTDYAAPVHAQDVCERLAKDLRAKADRLRREAHSLLARAEAVDECVIVAEEAAMHYEKWQPKGDE
jgi:hypothetical protein